MQYKDGRIILPINEYSVSGDTYNLNGINLTYAVFFVREEKKKFRLLLPGEYQIKTVGSNVNLEIQSSVLTNKIAVQVGYDYTRISSEYSVFGTPDIAILKDEYNKLAKDVNNLWEYIKKQGVTSDVLNSDIVIPKLKQGETIVFKDGNLEAIILYDAIEELKRSVEIIRREINDELDAKMNAFSIRIDGLLNSFRLEIENKINVGKNEITNLVNNSKTEINTLVNNEKADITDLAEDKKDEIRNFATAIVGFDPANCLLKGGTKYNDAVEIERDIDDLKKKEGGDIVRVKFSISTYTPGGGGGSHRYLKISDLNGVEITEFKKAKKYIGEINTTDTSGIGWGSVTLKDDTQTYDVYRSAMYNGSFTQNVINYSDFQQYSIQELYWSDFMNNGSGSWAFKNSNLPFNLYAPGLFTARAYGELRTAKGDVQSVVVKKLLEFGVEIYEIQNFVGIADIPVDNDLKIKFIVPTKNEYNNPKIRLNGTDYTLMRGSESGLVQLKSNDLQANSICNVICNNLSFIIENGSLNATETESGMTTIEEMWKQDSFVIGGEFGGKFPVTNIKTGKVYYYFDNTRNIYVPYTALVTVSGTFNAPNSNDFKESTFKMFLVQRKVLVNTPVELFLLPRNGIEKNNEVVVGHDYKTAEAIVKVFKNGTFDHRITMQATKGGVFRQEDSALTSSGSAITNFVKSNYSLNMYPVENKIYFDSVHRAVGDNSNLVITLELLSIYN